MSIRKLVWISVVVASVAVSCRSPVGTQPRDASDALDSEISKLSRTAARMHRNTSAQASLPLYREALDRARALSDFASSAAISYNIAVCKSETGEYADALNYATRATEYYRRAGRYAPEPVYIEAQLLTLLGRSEEAREAAGRALDEARAGSRRDMEARAIAMQVVLDAPSSDYGDHESALRDARRLAGRNPAPDIEAALANAEGIVASRSGRHADGFHAFRLEAASWGRAGMARRVANALSRAAMAAAEAGMVAEERQTWNDAAESLAGQGDDVGAKEMRSRAAAVR